MTSVRRLLHRAAILGVLAIGILRAPPASAQGNFGIPTPCPAIFYISSSFPVPTEQTPTTFKEFVFGYGTYSLNNPNVTAGIYSRISVSRDVSQKYIWLRGAIDVSCTKVFDALGSTIIVRWQGFIGGKAVLADRRASCNIAIIPEDPPTGAADGCTDDQNSGTYGDGSTVYPDEGTNVAENPPASVTSEPASDGTEPAGCMTYIVTIIWVDETGWWYWQGEAEVCPG